MNQTAGSGGYRRRAQPLRQLSFEGKGGVFKFRSGVVTLDELAPAYGKATGTQAKVVHAGNAEDITQEVQAAREVKGP
ncbi:unnamed protein product [Clonostachys rhizophaga]|uniref:Uncharacterized protein n=1 Tax=Clonostachys rhizophaga TaxID=160324 RepID=A0A9N9VCN0_9HYPO|nr:unnamed protein product [Clonostachys rhizophaga]